MKDFLLYIGNTYTKLCSAMSKHGILIGIMTTLVIIVVYSVLTNPININSIIDKAFEKERQEKINETELAVEKRLKADEVISPVLEEIIEKNKLGRAMVMELHNNTTNINGIDFLFYSATLEILNANEMDLDYVADDFQRQSISNQLGAIINNLKYKDYLYVDKVQECHHPNHQIIRRFGKLGAHSLLFVPIKNDKKRPIIIIVFTSKYNEIPYEQVLADLKPHLKLIKELLTK